MHQKVVLLVSGMHGECVVFFCLQGQNGVLEGCNVQYIKLFSLLVSYELLCHKHAFLLLQKVPEGVQWSLGTTRKQYYLIMLRVSNRE